MQISLSSPELLTFFFSRNLKIQDGSGRHLGFSGYVNLVQSSNTTLVITLLWYLSSVPNLVQIYVIVTEIDALMLLIFI